jgi:hypothetical protein
VHGFLCYKRYQVRVAARSQLMRALVTSAIYVTPFLMIGFAVKLLMKRRSIDLSDIQAQAGPRRRPRKVFLLGAWRKEE